MFKSGRAYFDGYGDIIHLRDHGNPRWPFTDGTRYFDVNGRFSGDNRNLDLLRPVGPIVTETVQRIKPGVYGILQVAEGMRPKTVHVYAHDSATAPELRELARVALEIAEYLDGLD